MAPADIPKVQKEVEEWWSKAQGIGAARMDSRIRRLVEEPGVARSSVVGGPWSESVAASPRS